MDGGAWQATVHGVAKSQTWLSDFTPLYYSIMVFFVYIFTFTDEIYIFHVCFHVAVQCHFIVTCVAFSFFSISQKAGLQGFAGGPVVKNLPANAEDARDAVQSLGWEDPLEEREMATHSSILAWKIPRKEWWAAVHGVAKIWT